MNRTSLRLLAASACLACAASAYAYDRAIIHNNAYYPVNVTIKYAACRSDSFTVPAKARTKGGSAGQATAPTNRGGCLITSITGNMSGQNYRIDPYSSSGTGYSQFYISYSGGSYKILSQWEVDPNEFLANNDSPEGDLAGSDHIPHPHRSLFGGKP
jgi:hypothetical protein